MTQQHTRDCNVIARQRDGHDSSMVVLTEKPHLPQVYGPMNVERSRDLLVERFTLGDADQLIAAVRERAAKTSANDQN